MKRTTITAYILFFHCISWLIHIPRIRHNLTTILEEFTQLQIPAAKVVSNFLFSVVNVLNIKRFTSPKKVFVPFIFRRLKARKNIIPPNRTILRPFAKPSSFTCWSPCTNLLYWTKYRLPCLLWISLCNCCCINYISVKTLLQILNKYSPKPWREEAGC